MQLRDLNWTNALVGGIAALLFGLITVLAKLQDGPIARRQAFLLVASVVLGIAVGSFCALMFATSIPAQLWFLKLDQMAAAAIIGAVAMRVAPGLVKRAGKWADGSTKE